MCCIRSFNKENGYKRKEEQRAVICFLNTEGFSIVDIRGCMRNVYGNSCISLSCMKQEEKLHLLDHSSPPQKGHLMDFALEHLIGFKQEGNHVCNRIVTGDETCLQLECEGQNCLWKHLAFLPLKRQRLSKSSAGKVVAFFFNQGYTANQVS